MMALGKGVVKSMNDSTARRGSRLRDPMDYFDGSSKDCGEKRTGLDSKKYSACMACGLPQMGGVCAYCGKDLEGQYHWHRKGFRKVKLCEECHHHQGSLHVPAMGKALPKSKQP